MIETKYVKGDTMPYRFDMDSLHGAGLSPTKAVMAALSAGNEITAGLRDAKEAAKHIFQKHQPADWIEIIRILIEDSF